MVLLAHLPGGSITSIHKTLLSSPFIVVVLNSQRGSRIHCWYLRERCLFVLSCLHSSSVLQVLIRQKFASGHNLKSIAIV